MKRIVEGREVDSVVTVECNYLYNRRATPEAVILPVWPMTRIGAGGVGNPGNTGTLSIISNGGLFLSAKHVFQVPPNEEGRRLGEGSIFYDPPSMYKAVFLNPDRKSGHYLEVKEIEPHPEWDVVIGRLGAPDPTRFFPFHTKLSRRILLPGSRVVAAGYPTEFRIDGRDPMPELRATGWFSGTTLNMRILYRENMRILYRENGGEIVERLPRGPLSGGPTYHHSASTPHAASGGPLIDPSDGAIVGIHCSGGEDYSMALELAPILRNWRVGLLKNRTLEEYQTATNHLSIVG